MGRPIDEAFAELNELIKKYPDLLAIGEDTGEDCCPREWITYAETKLGVTFPPSYVRFLMRHGGGYLAGNEISSVRDPSEMEIVAVFDVIHLTTSDWKLWDSPRHLILLMNNEGDVKHYLDTSVKEADGECPVVRWAIETPDKFEWYAESFVEYLIRYTKWLGPQWS